MPQAIRTRVGNCAFLVHDRPKTKREKDLLGYYCGTPQTDWEHAYAVLPATIVLIKKNIELEAQETDGDICRVIRETVWHEVGHYLGIDEERMETYEKKWEEKRNE